MTSNAARSIIWRGRASAPGYPFAAVRNERMRSLASSASLVHVVRRQGTPSISAHCILRVGAGAKERRAVWLIALFASAAAAKECRAKPASSSAHWHSIFLSSARCMKCYRHLILKSSLQGKEKGCLLCGASKRRDGWVVQNGKRHEAAMASDVTLCAHFVSITKLP